MRIDPPFTHLKQFSGEKSSGYKVRDDFSSKVEIGFDIR